MERSPPILKQVIPFESEHVVGVVFVGYLDEYGSNGLIYLTSHNRQIVQSLTFMNLPENTSLEPLWNILSGYKFSFDACPNKADINEMMNKSGIPVFDPDNEENTKSEMRSKLNEASTTP